MQWEFIVALAIAVPIILVPLALVWFLNLGGLLHAVQRRSKVAREKETRVEAK